MVFLVFVVLEYGVRIFSGIACVILLLFVFHYAEW